MPSALSHPDENVRDGLRNAPLPSRSFPGEAEQARADDVNKPLPLGSPRPTAEQLSAELAGYKILGRRYRRTLWFALRLFTRVIGWELVLRRLAGHRVVKRNRARRVRRWACEFRTLATDMGGVMIKLGQFISSRMDLLPPEIIEELATLQDEVPTVPFSMIRQTLDEELGSAEEHFASFDREPVAAASLGQAHRAQLADGARVVVKVQRPGIGSLVHTDLTALGVVARWVMKIPFIAHRVNVPALLDEFSAVLGEELDYTLEAEHVETLGRMFAHDKGIYIPRVYRAHSTRRVVTLEDVTAIKITDYERIEAAGINRRDVARRLINTYLWMIFIKRFFHADPHPGNLFVYPLPPGTPSDTGRHDNGQPLEGRPFYLVFVDFGMVGHLTPEITSGLRETLIAFTTRDARRLVEAYQRLGILLPGADLDRIEQAARATFDRVWGMTMSEISQMPVSEMVDLGREFNDLLFSMPFQVPQDFLVLVRCVGILTGICTGLDPGFDPWREVRPFVNALLVDSGEMPGLLNLEPRDLLKPQTIRALLSRANAALLLDIGWDMARRTVQLPALADDVLRRADRGELTVRFAPAPELERHVRHLESITQRLVSAVMFAGLAISSALLYSAGETTLSLIGFVLAGITFLRVVFGGKLR